MRTVVIYKEQTDHTRPVLTFLGDYVRQTGRTLETIDPETRDGARLCQTYDIVEYPSIVALDDSGVLQYLWKGLPLPTVSEVSYFHA